MPDHATCMTSRSWQNNIALTIIADIDNGTIHYDEELGAACVRFVRSLGCTFKGTGTISTSLVGGLTSYDNPCARMFSGTVGQSEPCNVSEQCHQPGFCSGPQCDRTTSCCPGTCDVRRIAAIGENCGSAFCTDDAYCSPLTSRCTALVLVTREGETCDAEHACVPPLYCRYVGHAKTGTCLRPANTGEDCTPGYIPCIDSRDYCAFDTNKCTRLAAVGESCDRSFCVSYAVCVNAVCVTELGAGAPCTTGIGSLSCIGQLSCVDSTCTPPPDGVACPVISPLSSIDLP